MSDLTRFRDHARTMATAEHSPDCRLALIESKNRWSHFCLFGEWPAKWGEKPASRPGDSCVGGCITDADRVLWARLADEADAYLDHESEETLL